MSWRVICPNGHEQEVAPGDWDDVFACPHCECSDAIPPPPRQVASHPNPLMQFVRNAAHLAPFELAPKPEASAAAPARVRTVDGGCSAASLQEFPDIPGFDILEEIGRGGMGVVFRARQQSLNRIVALKVIQTGPYSSEADRARFRAEAAAAARLRHANIVQVHEVGTTGGRDFMVLEFVAGGSLAEHLNGTPIAVRTAACFVATLADAVQTAHGQGIIHRDLKPSNILLGNPQALRAESTPDSKSGTRSRQGFASPEPKISDFGLAKQTNREEGDVISLTHSGTVLGTPSYMAPEQAAGHGKTVDASADVYSLGAILYEMLTGRPPFQAAGFLETLELVRSQEPLPPSRLQPGLPRDVQTICLKCLEKEPRRRYSSAAEIAEDLRRFVRGEPIAASPIRWPRRMWKWTRRNPITATFASLSTLAVTVLLLGVVVHNARLKLEVERSVRSEQEANRQRHRADHNYGRARDTLNAVLGRFDDKRLLDVPRLKELRQEVLEQSLAFYDGVLQETDTGDPTVPMDVALALEQTGTIQGALGRQPEAEHNLRRAVKLLEQLLREERNRPEVMSHLAECLSRLAMSCLAKAGPGIAAVKESLLPSDRAILDEAEAHLLRAIYLRKSLHSADPDQPRWLEELASTHRDLANIYMNGRKLDLAAEHSRRALELRSELFGMDSANPDFARSLAQAQIYFAWTETARQTMDQLEPHYTAAEELLKPFVQGLTEPEDARLLAQTYLGWGNLLRLHHRRHDQAVFRFTSAIQLMGSLLELEPRDVAARKILHNAYGARAYTHEDRGQFSRALRDWDRVLELSDGVGRAFNRSLRAISLGKSGAHAEAAAEARALAADALGFDDTVFNACLVFSLAYDAALRDEQLSLDSQRTAADGYASEALAMLNQLRVRGYFANLEHVQLLHTDPYLVFLRGRDDFQEFVREVEMTTGTQGT